MDVLSKEMQQEGKEYVYLAEFKGGYCKIGVSKNPSSRLKIVSNKNQISLKDYVIIEGYFELERMLHKHFKDKRRYSEWFEVDFNVLVEFVKNLEYEYIPKQEKEKTIKTESEKNIFEIKIGKEILEVDDFYTILGKENAYEKELTKELQELEKEFEIFLKNNYLFPKEKILKMIKIEKEYMTFLKLQKIKLGDELESLKEIELIIEFCYKYLLENY